MTQTVVRAVGKVLAEWQTWVHMQSSLPDITLPGTLPALASELSLEKKVTSVAQCPAMATPVLLPEMSLVPSPTLSHFLRDLSGAPISTEVASNIPDL